MDRCSVSHNREVNRATVLKRKRILCLTGFVNEPPPPPPLPPPPPSSPVHHRMRYRHRSHTGVARNVSSRQRTESVRLYQIPAATECEATLGLPSWQQIPNPEHKHPTDELSSDRHRHLIQHTAPSTHSLKTDTL